MAGKSGDQVKLHAQGILKCPSSRRIARFNHISSLLDIPRIISKFRAIFSRNFASLMPLCSSDHTSLT